MTQSEQILGSHSEWNLGSPGGWDYQRITQEIGKVVWERLFKNISTDFELDFDHPMLYPVNGLVNLMVEAHRKREGAAEEGDEGQDTRGPGETSRGKRETSRVPDGETKR